MSRNDSEFNSIEEAFAYFTEKALALAVSNEKMKTVRFQEKTRSREIADAMVAECVARNVPCDDISGTHEESLSLLREAIAVKEETDLIKEWVKMSLTGNYTMTQILNMAEQHIEMLGALDDSSHPYKMARIEKVKNYFYR